jgi:tRNA(fMet)-specific endonuclease VapC
MSGRYLLDTNIAIRILNNELDLEARPEDESEAFLCVTVVGELFFGAERSGRPEANKARVDRLMELCPLVPHDLATARHYGAVKKRLLQQGRPIPENDIWIAAAALQHGLTVATGDPHFGHVEGLPVESW